jgi:hypothetical protein
MIRCHVRNEVRNLHSFCELKISYTHRHNVDFSTLPSHTAKGITGLASIHRAASRIYVWTKLLIETTKQAWMNCEYASRVPE